MSGALWLACSSGARTPDSPVTPTALPTALPTEPHPRDRASLVATRLGVCTLHENMCVLRRDGLWCWGYSIGLPSPPEGNWFDRRHLEPYRVPLDATPSSVVLSDESGCLLADGEVHCWGRYFPGTKDSLHCRAGVAFDPAPVSLPEPATQIATYDTSTCALLQSGRATCWGPIPIGLWECGYHVLPTDAGCVRVPLVDAEGAPLEELVELRGSTAIDRNGRVWAWNFGRDRSAAFVASPVDGLPPAQDVVRHGEDVCVLSTEGQVVCRHALDRTLPPTPGPVEHLRTLTCSDDFCCGLTQGGELHCWGNESRAMPRAQWPSGRTGVSAVALLGPEVYWEEAGKLLHWVPNASGRPEDVGFDVEEVPLPAVDEVPDSQLQRPEPQ